MQTECNATRFDFARVESRSVMAGFDGGVITSDAGGLLLGATGRAIQLGDPAGRSVCRLLSGHAHGRADRA